MKSGSSLSSSATTGQPPDVGQLLDQLERVLVVAWSLTIATSGSSSAIAAATPSGEVARATTS